MGKLASSSCRLNISSPSNSGGDMGGSGSGSGSGRKSCSCRGGEGSRKKVCGKFSSVTSTGSDSGMSANAGGCLVDPLDELCRPSDND